MRQNETFIRKVIKNVGTRQRQCRGLQAYLQRQLQIHKEGLKERLPIYLHDMTAYTLIKTDETKSGYKMVRLKYCPYCGVEIETDERG